MLIKWSNIIRCNKICVWEIDGLLSFDIYVSRWAFLYLFHYQHTLKYECLSFQLFRLCFHSILTVKILSLRNLDFYRVSSCVIEHGYINFIIGFAAVKSGFQDTHDILYCWSDWIYSSMFQSFICRSNNRFSQIYLHANGRSPMKKPRWWVTLKTRHAMHRCVSLWFRPRERSLHDFASSPS